MTKARMSDRRDRYEGALTTLFPDSLAPMTEAERQFVTGADVVAAAAILEAQAILAETEHWIAGQTTWFPCGVERLALAESLAAFIETLERS